MKIHVGRRAGAHIENRLLGARRRVCVCSPWISQEYMERILNLCRCGVSVRVIMADCENNGAAVEMIRKFVKGEAVPQSKGTPQFEALIVKCRDLRSDYGLHAKVYVIDGD